MKRVVMYFLVFRPRKRTTPSRKSVPETEENPDGVHPVTAAQVRTRLREEPLRRRAGEETTCATTHALRDTGERRRKNFCFWIYLINFAVAAYAPTPT